MSGQNSDTTKVLFVGNSYTYFWNLPQVIEAMASTQDVAITTRQSTAGGSNLGQHWRGQKQLKTDSLINSTDWDFVVLQDHSLRAVEAADSLAYFTSLWAKKIRRVGATPMLYMTWPRAYDPLMGQIISQVYEETGEKEDITVVPVGKAWSLALHLKPDLPLHDKDESHPAPLGTYLTALIFYKSLTGKSVDNIPPRLITKDKDGEKLYLMIVHPDEAQFCRRVVNNIFEDCNNCLVKEK